MSSSRSRLSRAVIVGVAVAGLMISAAIAPASAQEEVPDFTAAALAPSVAPEDGAKSASGRLAQSDDALLARTDAAVTPVMVKVDVDPVASYAGGVDGFAATSPDITGTAISDGSAAITKYTAYVDERIAAAQAEALALIPDAKVLANYATVYGGYALSIPANRAKDLLKLGSVAAVQANELHQIAVEDSTPSATPEATPEADPSASPVPEETVPEETAPEQAQSFTSDLAASVALPPTTPAPDMDATTFIGADKVWPSLGGRDKAGAGVIVGVIDTGIWPEHPMLADVGLAAPAGG
ncbi:MAG: hypothetical protein ABWY55_05015, partial [Microbacterium sp.]